MVDVDNESYNTVLDFSKKLVEKFDGLIRVVALFGSHAKKTHTNKSDVDVLIIVDDIYNIWDDVVKAYYYKTLAEILNKDKFKKIHANTISLSVFWEMVKVGDPLAINILRYGIPVLDSFGMFAALKKMLMQGKIRPSEEAIIVIKSRIPSHINMYYYHLVKSLEMVYWIFVDSAHYMLMSLGHNPPSPDEIPLYLESLVQSKVLKDVYLKWYKAIYELVHKLAHREISEISGNVVEEWFQRAIDFKKAMEEIVKKHKSKKL
ncbi:MAG TPA: nucleotidyltransferase domain-containing protein [Candidatus Nanopusillus sp.]|nr:nucleotidyltransferase domain-containing protein [Candidatus Nanopusillus sp.]